MDPYSLDIFEGRLYWVSKEKGEVWTQDKFGQDKKEKMLTVSPWLTQVRVFHQHRYNQSGTDLEIWCSLLFQINDCIGKCSEP